MKISIVTIVFNDRNNIETTILNIINQTARKEIEYIIIDGNSSDGTSEIINKYKNFIDIYIREKDKGIYDAMNKGILNATGDYIIFINSGDSLASKNTIEEILKRIHSENYDLIYGNYQEIDKKSNYKSPLIDCRNPDKIWYGPIASHQSTLYNLNFIKSHNLTYDLSYKIAADYKLTAQVIKLGSKFLKTNICISYFDIGGVSSTNQNAGLKEANRVRKEVFEWGNFKIGLITIILLGARITKKYLKPIYKILR